MKERPPDLTSDDVREMLLLCQRQSHRVSFSHFLRTGRIASFRCDECGIDVGPLDFKGW